MDTCIALRTMVLADGVAYLQAGAGIVADSDPAAEHEECLHKLAALEAAIDLAENGIRVVTVLVLDNYDSFTYNLVHLLEELGADVVVYRNDALTADEAEALRPDRLVVSPGPGRPAEAGISVELIRRLGPRCRRWASASVTRRSWRLSVAGLAKRARCYTARRAGCGTTGSASSRAAAGDRGRPLPLPRRNDRPGGAHRDGAHGRR